MNDREMRIKTNDNPQKFKYIFFDIKMVILKITKLTEEVYFLPKKN